MNSLTGAYYAANRNDEGILGKDVNAELRKALLSELENHKAKKPPLQDSNPKAE